MKIDSLKVFIAVCENLSFTKAALNLSMPKAKVSYTIKDLEEGLGVQLLTRTTRKLSITPEGMECYERAIKLVNEMEDFQAMFLHDTDDKLSGKIRIDMPVPVAKNCVLPNLSEFIDKYPGLEIEISSTDRKVNLIEEGIDLIIRVGSLQDSSLFAKKIGEYELLNCVSPKYIERFGTPRSLKSLKDHFQVHYCQQLGRENDYFEYMEEGKIKKVRTKALVSVNSTEAYTAACLEGLGIIQAPYSGLRDSLEKGDLVEVLKKYKAEAMGVYFLYSNRKFLARRVRVFMEWVEPYVKDYIYS